MSPLKQKIQDMIGSTQPQFSMQNSDLSLSYENSFLNRINVSDIQGILSPNQVPQTYYSHQQHEQPYSSQPAGSRTNMEGYSHQVYSECIKNFQITSITGLKTMTALRPSHSQGGNRKKKNPIGNPFLSSKIALNKPQAAQQIFPQDKERQSRVVQIRELVQRQHIEQKIKQTETMLRDPSLFQFQDQTTYSQKSLERARSRYLLDKLTGKAAQERSFYAPRASRGEIRPQITGSGMKKLDLFAPNEETYSHSEDMPQQSETSEGDPNRGDYEVEGLRDEQEERKEWSELDKYIELLLDSKQTDQSIFVYLKPDKENPNPYDLKVCTYQERIEDKYYTLSGKGITMYNADGPVEFIQLGDWLMERSSYNHIKELSFFKKFRRWKFLRMWRKTINSHKRVKAANALKEKLFILNPTFRQHLIKHRQYCLDMEQLRFISVGNRTGISRSFGASSVECQSIESFSQMQQKQRALVNEDVQKYSDQCRENVNEAIMKILSDLRERIIGDLQKEDEARRMNAANKGTNQAEPVLKQKKAGNVFESLGFPDDMTYGHRSTLRKECSRFLRFAYLIDFVAMEALSEIYLGSLRDLLQKLYHLDR